MNKHLRMGMLFPAISVALLAGAALGAKPELSSIVSLSPSVRVDRSAGVVEVDAQVVLREGSLELLACLKGTKEHESILVTSARPSHIHAALLSLGLLPGKPITWSNARKDASPVPPDGARLEVSLKYRNARGQVQNVPAAAWLSRHGQAAELPQWVFVGSELTADGLYWADSEGEVITVSNFEAALIDVPFASTTDDANLEFSANTAVIPPLGTPVTIIIKPAPGAQSAAVARALFEVDRFGVYRLEGESRLPADIEAWAKDFVARHAHPYVVIQASARALVYDVERLKEVLAQANIYEVTVRMEPISGEILPRSPSKLRQAMLRWSDHFAHYRDLINEPGQEAELVLRQLEFQRRELAELERLWEQYQRELQKELEHYQSSTRPAVEKGHAK